MTTEQRRIQSILKHLNFKLFIAEVSFEMESESGMMNRILTERYATYSAGHRENLLKEYERLQKSIK